MHVWNALRFWCHASYVRPYDVENLRDGVTHHIHGSHGEVVIALQQVVRLAKVSRPIRVGAGRIRIHVVVKPSKVLLVHNVISVRVQPVAIHVIIYGARDGKGRV